MAASKSDLNHIELLWDELDREVRKLSEISLGIFSSVLACIGTGKIEETSFKDAEGVRSRFIKKDSYFYESKI